MDPQFERNFLTCNIIKALNYERALRKQTRPNSDQYETGENVYYKRPGKEWKGPGIVIGLIKLEMMFRWRCTIVMKVKMN